MVVCACLLAASAGCATSTSHEASGRVHVYADPRITVVAPSARERLKLDALDVTADYGVDVVSGATQALTVDAVSSATRFSDQRHQLGVDAARTFSPELRVSVGYGLSAEADHVVHSPSLGVSSELWDQMVRVSARYQAIFEATGRTGDPGFLARAVGHRVDLGWTQIITRTLAATALATATAWQCDPSIGCFANPYRYLGIAGAGAGRLALIERHPADRLTGAGSLGVSWAPLENGAAHLTWRFSADSWGVTAHTGDLALAGEFFGRRLLVRTEVRATAQSEASFYRARYEANDGFVPAYRTADAELSRLWNLRLQLHLEWSFGWLRLVVEAGRLWNHYPDFPSLPVRHAWLGGLGLDLEL